MTTYFHDLFVDMVDNKFTHYVFDSMPNAGCFESEIKENMFDPRKIVWSKKRQDHIRGFWTSSETMWRSGPALWKKELRYQIHEIQRLVKVAPYFI